MGADLMFTKDDEDPLLHPGPVFKREIHDMGIELPRAAIISINVNAEVK